MSYLNIENLVKSYGSVTAVKGLDLAIGEGEMLVLLGPSGCGKTTTMRCVVGLERPDTGRIVAAGRVLFDAASNTEVPAGDRGMGMVFQSYAIWPHKSVFENVAFPLRMQHLGKREIRDRVAETLELVGLTGYDQRGASALSGGQMQRVALARSLAMRPKVLLFDEPLSNLDAKLREKLRFELREIQQSVGITGIYVTHDQAEALALADRIAVMSEGNIVQLDEPVTLYHNPADVFVADFLGSSNILRGLMSGDVAHPTVSVDNDVLIPVVARDGLPPSGASVDVSIRAEGIELQDAMSGSGTPGVVGVASFLGSQVRYQVRLAGGAELYVTAAETGRLFKAGAEVNVGINAEAVRVFPA